MKKLLKDRKFREVLKLAETNIIGIYIFENGDFHVFDVEETKKKLFMEGLVKVFPSILRRTNYEEVESKSLQELKSAMTEIVAVLPERRKMVMTDFLGLTDDIPADRTEIAEKHNITLPKVSELFHYAREQLWQRESLGRLLRILGIKDLWKNTSDDVHEINEIPFTTHTYHALVFNGFSTLEQLSSKTEKDILRMHHFGKKSVSEVKTVMSKFGLSFAIPEMSKDL